VTPRPFERLAEAAQGDRRMNLVSGLLIACVVACLVGCGGSNTYAGYTKKQARLAARVGLAKLLRGRAGPGAAITRSRKFTIVGMRHARSSNGGPAWRVRFWGYDQSQEFQDQYCIWVWVRKQADARDAWEESETCE
jgi:hypothetical protein